MTDGGRKDSILLAKWRLLLLASVDPDVTKSDTAVLAYILDCINSKTKMAFPALTRIAESAHVDRGTATRSIRRLEEFDYLRKKPGDRVRANEYRMGEGRCVHAPRCSAAASCGDAPDVGAGMQHEVGAGMRLQSGKSLPKNRTKERSLPPSVRSDEKIDQSEKNQTIDDFLKTIAPGEYVFPEEHPFNLYTRKIGLGSGFIELAWRAFKDRYRGTEHRQPDWRSWFLRYVKENWGKLWRIEEGIFVLTTAGEQLRLEHEADTGRTIDVY